MSRRPLALLAILALLVIAPGGATVFAAQGPTLAALRADGAAEVQEVYLRPPTSVADDEPLQVLVALHGMGGNGSQFGDRLASQADAHGWLIVAPTIRYGDWTDPQQIAHEDPALIAWLSELVRQLPERTGYEVQPRILLFGYSRGAQLSLRFTEIHPEQVTGVAALAAGTYTLPRFLDPRTNEPLPFPFGVADLAATDGGKAFDARAFQTVPVWVGVGSADTNVSDAPSAWTPFIGDDRLERAQVFAQALQEMGGDVSLTVFPGVGHALTDEMRAAACGALAAAAST